MRRVHGVLVGLVLGAASICRAETVTATLDSVDPSTLNAQMYLNSNSEVGGSGLIKWTNASTTDPSADSTFGTEAGGNKTFYTFCIDLVQNIQEGNNYTYSVNIPLSDAPPSGAYTNSGVTGPMGVAKADEIEALYGLYYNNDIIGAGATETNKAAFQLAIWNILYDTDQTVTSGNFYASDTLGTLTSADLVQADAFLAAASTSTDYATNLEALEGMTPTDAAQDQIAVVGGSVTTSVPLPRPIWGAGVLLGGLILSQCWNRRRLASRS
jgi:hypothetical protein